MRRANSRECRQNLGLGKLRKEDVHVFKREKNSDTRMEGERPVVHSDRGAHYRRPAWLSRMEAAGLPRSMSNGGFSTTGAGKERNALD